MSVPHSLLALLSTAPMYGQQLKSEFEARTGSLWPLNVGQVYTSLDRLERDGLVQSSAGTEGDAKKRPYVITPPGQVELDLWLKAAPPAKAPPRDDVIMKVMIAVSIDPAGSVEIVQSQRRQLLERMRDLTHLKASPAADTPLLLMCDAELFRLEASVRWLDTVDARVRGGATMTAPQATDQTAPEPASMEETS